MKSPSGIAMAVRRDDGSIATDYQTYESKAKKGTFWAWPIVRGVVTFAESLILGSKTIMKSAELFGEDAVEEPGKFEKWLAEKTGKSIEKIIVGVAAVLAVFISVGLFFMLPTFISSLVLSGSEVATIWKSLIEGAVRLVIFFTYIILISSMKDVKRLFMYHGAEHKVIACYEHEAPLTPEEAKQYTRFHPRCGTNYLFLVMAVSILFFTAVGWNANFWIRLGTRLLFLPVVAGLSYEVLRFGAKSDNLISRIVRAPGVALQHLTTKEPDEDMLEVAITAFNLALNPPTEEELAAMRAAAAQPREKAADPAESEAESTEPETDAQSDSAAAEAAVEA